NGVRVPQFEREPVSNSPWTPQRGIEAMDKAGVDIAYLSHASNHTKNGYVECAALERGDGQSQSRHFLPVARDVLHQARAHGAGPQEPAQVRNSHQIRARVERVWRPHHGRFQRPLSLSPGAALARHRRLPERDRVSVLIVKTLGLLSPR